MRNWNQEVGEYLRKQIEGFEPTYKELKPEFKANLALIEAQFWAYL